jgi:hypothetical protein
MTPAQSKSSGAWARLRLIRDDGRVLEYRQPRGCLTVGLLLLLLGAGAATAILLLTHRLFFCFLLPIALVCAVIGLGGLAMMLYRMRLTADGRSGEVLQQTWFGPLRLKNKVIEKRSVTAIQVCHKGNLFDVNVKRDDGSLESLDSVGLEDRAMEFAERFSRYLGVPVERTTEAATESKPKG